MTLRTRRSALAVAVGTPIGLACARVDLARAEQPRGSGCEEARDAARAWFAALNAGRLDPRTHPSIVLVLHGYGAALDGSPERFEGREAVAAVLAGAGAADWTVEDVLAEKDRAALRGGVRLRDGRTAAFTAHVTLRDGHVVRVERHLDRVLRTTEVS